MPERPATRAFADDDDDDGHGQPCHFEQVFGDGLGLPALLGFEAGIRAGRVEQRHDGLAELGGHLHESKRLAVALRVGHPEAAELAAARVAALLVADEHHGAVAVVPARAFEPRQPAHDGGVVAEEAVAVQLEKIVGERVGVVERVGAQRVAGDLDALPAREVAVDLAAQLVDAAFERADLGRQVNVELLGVERPHLVELAFEFVEGLLEFQQMLRHGHGGVG